MTREHAIAEREAFNAFCDGKAFQQRRQDTKGEWGPWHDCDSPIWDSVTEHRVTRMNPCCEHELRFLDGLCIQCWKQRAVKAVEELTALNTQFDELQLRLVKAESACAEMRRVIERAISDRDVTDSAEWIADAKHSLR